MTDINFPQTDLPYPHHWFRKHDFGGRDYVTLSVMYVRERLNQEGKPLPRLLRCTMFGTLLTRQEELSAPDIASGQMMLDALFSRRFPDHECGEGCTGGWSKSGGDKGPFDEGPVTHMVQ